jgi:hypothetical protein
MLHYAIQSTSGRKLARWLAWLATCLLTLSGCSLATSIQRDALDYNATVANYNDQVLLYTILRARDEAPINILTLSTINGALSMQSGVGGSTTYSTHSSDPKLVGAITPSISGASSPTWSMASLNTQAFMLGIIQPISPMYIVSKWNTGVDREFLLRLFIKSVSITQDGKARQYLNNPESPRETAEFAALMHSWVPALRMRSLTVLEPLGPTFDPSTIPTTRTIWDDTKRTSTPTRIDVQQARNEAMETLLEAYQHLIPLGSGSYFVGNAPPVAAGGPPRLQLYREYPQQVVLCVPKSTLSAAPSSGSVAPAGMIEEEEQEEESALSRYALQLKAAAKGGAGRESSAPASTRESAPGHVTGNTSRPTGVQTNGSLSNDLKTDRVAAVLPLGACGKDELVLPPFTEEENSGHSGAYSHVQWRSVAEVIKFLGTLLRTADPAGGGDRWQESDENGTHVTHVLFDLTSGQATGFASIDYRGSRYTVHSITDAPQSAVRDHSMEALSLLNELVSVAKVSSDIPNTQSIQIVP